MKLASVLCFFVLVICLSSVAQAQLPTGQGVRIRPLSFIQMWGRNFQVTTRAAQIGLFNGTRSTALFHVAAWDIVNAYNPNPTYTSYGNPPAPPADSDLNAAIIGAGFTVYTSQFPSETDKYEAQRAFHLAWLRRTSATAGQVADGYDYGASIAQALVDSRANDGYNVIPVYSFLGTPGTFRCACTPVGQGWGAVTPWTLPNQDAEPFVPPGPSFVNDPQEYVLDYNEILGRGVFNESRTAGGPSRTPIETFVGVLWSIDTFGTTLPPAAYFEMAQNIAAGDGFDLRTEARFLAQLSLTLADTHIVAWRTKYRYSNWRPATGVPFAGTDDYVGTIPDLNWVPLGPTPPFPDYISGHSTFGGAVGRFLQLFFSTDRKRFRVETDALPKVSTTYFRFSDFQTDNAYSRVYLGVHWRQSCTDGISTGIRVANSVWANGIVPL